MHIKNIRCIEEKLAEAIRCEFDKGIENVNTAEMGKATDMLKDAAEAEYYARIAKAMEKADNEDEEADKHMLKQLKEQYGEDDGRRYYDNYRYMRTGRFAPKGRGTYMPRRGYETPIEYHMTPEMYREHDPEYYRDVDRNIGRMYYTETGMSGNTGNSSRTGMRDGREGRSGMSRRSYMQTKEMHPDNSQESKQAKMKELEKYMGELSGDITEMIAGASNEEKTMLKAKLQTLMQKI